MEIDQYSSMKRYFLVFGQVLLLIVAGSSVAVFMRFHVINSAIQFESDFRSQSFFELSNGEIHVIARKLSALSKKSDLICVIGVRNGTTFFEEMKSSCDEGLFRHESEIDQKSFGIKIKFVHGLPKNLSRSLMVMLATFLLMGVLLVMSQRRQFYYQHESELTLARLSRQIAHDLRSPLAVIRAISRRLGTLKEKELLNSAIERLDALIRTLSSDTIVHNRSPTLERLLQSSITEKLIEVGENNANINTEWLAPVKAALLPGDPFKWRRIISNLLNNSIEASVRPKICVSVDLDNCGTDHVRISIKDNGGGFPKEVIEALGPRPFSKGKEGGRGIGISSAFSFLREIDGSMEIRNNDGYGASVTLISPFEIERTAILIEDDVALARIWIRAGKQHQISVSHFHSPSDYLSAKINPSIDTFFYLDLNFSNGESGDSLGRRLRSAGYKNLFLCSGASGLQLASHPWARAILGKEPPWLT